MSILTVDVGTTSMRGILYSRNGKQLTIHRISYQNFYSEQIYVEQDAKTWGNALVQILKVIAQYCKINHATVSAIALTCQRSSVIPLDKEGNPLEKCIMWQDTRTKAICSEIERYNDEIHDLTGAKVNTVFSAPKILWFKKERRNIYNSAYKMVGIADFLNYKLTNRWVTDYTYGSRTLLMNLRSKKWDERLLQIFDIDQSKLCDLIEPGAVCGLLCTQMSMETGLPEGIPIITAGGDQQCALVGKGAIESGDLSITTGTGAFLSATCLEVPSNLSTDIICNVSSLKNQYIIETNALSCTAGFDWFLNNFYDRCNMSYEEIAKKIDEVPVGANGCRVLPYFQGKSAPDWNPNAKAMFANLSLGTTREDMLRGLMEAMFLEIKEKLEVMNQYVPISDVYLGGGLSKNRILNQLQADVYGKVVKRSCREEETSIGAFLITMVCMGYFKDITFAHQEVNKNIQNESYQPNLEKTNQYNEIMKENGELYKINNDQKRECRCLENE
ncbi:MAG: FGGY-family carbohydrate kinase [Eubacteriales bacterium]